MDETDVEGEVIFLIGGDKCGNVHLFKIEKLKSHWLDESKPDEGEDSLSSSLRHLSLVKPIQTMTNVTKESAAISSMYSKKAETNKYSVVCCCQDGFYRVFEFDLGYMEPEEEDEDVEMTQPDEEKPSAASLANMFMLKMVNKYQINSYIDILESLLFDEENDQSSFDLEKNLKLALCFYGDKFLLWSFHLSRSLFEFRCGGANRSWDYEFQVPSRTVIILKF